MTKFNLSEILGDDSQHGPVRIVGEGPPGSLPIDAEQLLNEPSGNLFAMTQNVAMGWRPEDVGRAQYLIMSTQGGLRAEDGSPLALPCTLLSPAAPSGAVRAATSPVGAASHSPGAHLALERCCLLCCQRCQAPRHDGWCSDMAGLNRTQQGLTRGLAHRL